jgi:hypothetical protein
MTEERAGDIVNSSGNTVPAGYGVLPNTRSAGSIYALIGPSTPEWRRIIKIDGDPIKGFTTEVVSDYKRVKDVTDAVQRAMEELADSDDTPQEQQLLMTAWQALAMYLSTCDDEDKSGALQALKTVSNLMSDGADDGPLPQGTFGVTTQTAATTFSCPKCKRTFATEAGLISHLKSVHNARAKQPYGKSKGDAPVQEQD